MTSMNAVRIKAAGQKRLMAEYLGRTQPKFVLRTSDGMFLHWSGAKLTARRSEAWSGSLKQLHNIRKALSLAASCKPDQVQ